MQVSKKIAPIFIHFKFGTRKKKASNRMRGPVGFDPRHKSYLNHNSNGFEQTVYITNLDQAAGR
jgi:hypothetical protein